jgi:prepilin peptidase CpaA
MIFNISIESACEWIPIAAAVVLTCIAAGFDLKYMKIPNKLNLVGIIVGIAINVGLYGLHGLAGSGLGILAGFAFILMYAFGVLGAGDVKLFMAVGAMEGQNCA